MDWFDLAQDRDKWGLFVNTIMNLRILQNFGKFLSSRTTDGFKKNGSAPWRFLYLPWMRDDH
jgi:hypothetical protein